MGIRRRSLGAASIGCIAAICAASPAVAGTLTRVAMGGGTFRYEYRDTAAAVENVVEIHHDDGEDLSLRVLDAVLNTTAMPPGCVQIVAGRSMRCPEDVVRIDVFTGPAADTVHFEHAGLTGINKVSAPARVYGQGGADCLEGTDQDDEIDGGGPAAGESGTGNDRIFGSSGSDTIIGEDGDGILYGFWLAATTASGGCLNRENPVVADLDDAIDGGAGNDTIVGDAGTDRITDALGPNTLTNGNAAALNGGAGDDTIQTGAGSADLIDGGPDNDTIAGSSIAGATAVNGDVLRGGAGSDNVTGGTARDTLEGGPGEDTLAAGAGADTIFGATQASSAGDLQDTITPGFGRDSVDGGDGLGDVVRYVDGGRTAPVVVALNAGGAGDGSVDDEEGGARDTLTDVENLVGSPFSDTLTGSDAVNVLNGSAGDDTLAGEAGDDTLSGQDGDDVMDGGTGADTVAGGVGAADVADYAGRTGPVSVTLGSPGGADDDGTVLIDGPTATTLDDVDTTEVVRGGAAADRLTADPATGSRLVGNGGDDTLSGGAGPDTLDGGPGADDADGNAGVDLMTYAAVTEPVVVTLGDGVADDGGATDTSGSRRDATTDVESAVGGSGADVLTGDDGANRLDGGAGDDVLRGRLGADELVGGAGTDLATYAERGDPVALTMDGGANDGAPGEGDLIAGDIEAIEGGGGNDTLTGSAAADRLTGGGGDDVLVGLPGTDALSAGPGNDTVDAQDGVPDEVDCGEGADGGTADAADTLLACETVTVPVVVIDADRDGVPAGLDCDDADPARRPGAIEIVGNRVDEDCLGGPAPFPLIGANVSVFVKIRGGRTRFTKVTVTSIPAGGRVRLTCQPPDGRRHRRACPFKRVQRTFAKTRKTLDLLDRFRNRRFVAGVVVQLRVTHPMVIGKVRKVTTRRGKLPRSQSLCVTPGRKRAGRCP